VLLHAFCKLKKTEGKKSVSWEFSFPELLNSNLTVTKTAKYHMGAEDSTSHWQFFTSAECAQYTIHQAREKRQLATFFTNNETKNLDGTFNARPNVFEISPKANALALLFMLAIMERVPFPEADAKRNPF